MGPSNSTCVTAAALVDALLVNRVSHIPYLPDSEHSATYDLLVATPSIRLVRVAREGEAIAIAAGLLIGGMRPLVMIQNTGMFESGDSIRGFLLTGLGLPLVMAIGYRGWVPSGTPRDTAALYTEPILAAWGIRTVLIASDADLPALAECFAEAERTGKPSAALLVEDERYAAAEQPPVPA
jgi:sulfopyruvate decarboxylase TPP-binding subunit